MQTPQSFWRYRQKRDLQSSKFNSPYDHQMGRIFVCLKDKQKKTSTSSSFSLKAQHFSITDRIANTYISSDAPEN